MSALFHVVKSVSGSGRTHTSTDYMNAILQFALAGDLALWTAAICQQNYQDLLFLSTNCSFTITVMAIKSSVTILVRKSQHIVISVCKA